MRRRAAELRLAVLEATNEEIEATLRALDEECEQPRGAEGVDDAPVSPPSSPQKDSEEEGPSSRATPRSKRKRAGRPRARRSCPRRSGPRAGRVRHPRDGGRGAPAHRVVLGRWKTPRGGRGARRRRGGGGAGPGRRGGRGTRRRSGRSRPPKNRRPRSPHPQRSLPWKRRTRPRRTRSSRKNCGRARPRAAVLQAGPPAPEADGEEDAPAPPPSLAPEERLVQFGVLEPIIVEAAVEEAAAPAPAPLEASDITAAVVEAADDSTVATEDQQQPKEEAEEEPVPLEPINEELVIDLDSDAPLTIWSGRRRSPSSRCPSPVI